MQYNDLLARSWPNLGHKDRKQALRQAYQAGRHAAEQALIGKGGSDLLSCRSDADLADFFFYYLIEDAEFSQRLADQDRTYWDKLSGQKFPEDPRIIAFSDGWRLFMEQEVLQASPLLKALFDSCFEILHRPPDKKNAAHAGNGSVSASGKGDVKGVIGTNHINGTKDANGTSSVEHTNGQNGSKDPSVKFATTIMDSKAQDHCTATTQRAEHKPDQLELPTSTARKLRKYLRKLKVTGYS